MITSQVDCVYYNGKELHCCHGDNYSNVCEMGTIRCPLRYEKIDWFNISLERVLQHIEEGNKPPKKFIKLLNKIFNLKGIK